MDYDAIAEALAQAIRDADLSINEFKVNATAFSPDVPMPPAFFVAEATGTYDKTFNGDDPSAALTELQVTCRLMLSRADVAGGQSSARTLAGTGEGTIRAALLAQRRNGPDGTSLGGACDDLRLTGFRGPRIYDYGADGHYLGMEFTIHILG